ncbi:MAG: hypothetical protein V7L20_13620 [Nostoc sp.]|uniref:hypothetical protein n=1 Tax=Nostoc sp. TaxID=1180 RepID=UPI002FFBF94D
MVLGPNAQPQELAQPIAVKFVDVTQSIARTNPVTSAIELNVEPAKVFKASESSWLLPNFSQANIDTQIPTPQLID